MRIIFKSSKDNSYQSHRTVARDLRRLGGDETTCMSITGHVSPIMFRRYAGIIDPSEQKAALTAREALLEREGSSVAHIGTR